MVARVLPRTAGGFLVPYLGTSPFPRKEVIQAHLPVHLPCYDLVPVTSTTFDSAFPRGLGYRLQVLPAPMT